MLSDRTVLVTGASSGVGRGLVHSYVAAGASVFGVGRDAAELAATAAGLPEERVEMVAADLTTDAGRRAVVTAVEHEGRLDVAVHSAGALGPVGVSLADYPADVWDQVLAINMTAVQRLHQGLAGFLERSAAPVVIGVSSTVGREGRAGWGAYSVSKFALEGWLAVLSGEFAGRVYSVNPGATRTPMRAAAAPEEDPMTLPTTEDIAPVFLHLAHPATSVPSGAQLNARDWIGRDPWEGLQPSV